jgi:hypothetical protein
MDTTFQLLEAAHSFTAAQNSIRKEAPPESLLHTFAEQSNINMTSGK